MIVHWGLARERVTLEIGTYVLYRPSKGREAEETEPRASKSKSHSARSRYDAELNTCLSV